MECAIIQVLGITVLVPASLITALIFFGKKTTELWLNKNLDLHKSNLQNQLEISKIQFSNLHSKRMEFIEQIHTNLFDLHDLINSYLQTTYYVPNDAENEEYQREKQTFELLGKIQNDFKKQKLYLSETLSDKIEKLINTLSTSCFQGNFFKNSLNDNHISDEDWKSFKQELKTLSENNRNEIPLILADIESDFREIFGIK